MVGRAAVLEAARLARLDLPPDELERIVTQVAAILDHVEELTAIPVAGADPLAGIAEGQAPLRPDVPGADPLASPPAAFATGWTDGFFTVPRLSAMETPPAGTDV